jgi:hypothetical protein
MPDVILLALAQRPPSRLGDPQSGDLDPVIAREHALGRHARESGADQLDQHLDREAVRPPRSRRCGTRAVRAVEQWRRWTWVGRIPRGQAQSRSGDRLCAIPPPLVWASGWAAQKRTGGALWALARP